MPSAESSNKFLLIKIKFQVLKLLECIEKLSEFEQKDAVHFILYRISRIRRSKVKESLDFWGKLTSGHFGRRRKLLGKKDWTKDRQLLRLKRPENVSGLVSYWFFRKTFEDFQRNSRVFRKFLHLNSWDLLHRSICGDFTRRIFENPLLDISLNDEDDEEVGELEYLMHDSDSPPQLAVKTAKRKTKKIPKRAKVPKKEVFPCFHCPKSYKRRQNVVDHYAAKHRGFCPDCGDEIGLNAQGKVHHNRSKHLEEYPFVCEICGESMSRNQQYQNHIAVHSRKSLMPVKPPSPKKPKVEKPPKINRYAIVLPDGVICPVCGLKFRNPSLLNAHRARHHAKSTFQCEICSEVFKFRTSYTRHKRIHTVQEKKFTCETCGLKYMTNSALKDHLKLTHERVVFHVRCVGRPLLFSDS
ncbi:zinc finger protein 517-like isoform X1 [Lutzomyia longipalpis]|uniref:zinc finger protein 517-like isoform X1 n=1 Tax=Lutzomyia longipalpis TaxID=7200 RepID=UPI002483EF21|nr:zinc finger protein 517-like isoform X1 [Lutzomyia longipalpis]